MVVKKATKRVLKNNPPPEQKELKRIGDVLIEIRDILNNIWRERRP